MLTVFVVISCRLNASLETKLTGAEEDVFYLTTHSKYVIVASDMNKNQVDSEMGNPLPQRLGLLFSINSKECYKYSPIETMI